MASVGGVGLTFPILCCWDLNGHSQNKLQAGFKWVKLYYHDEDGGQSSLI